MSRYTCVVHHTCGVHQAGSTVDACVNQAPAPLPTPSPFPFPLSLFPRPLPLSLFLQLAGASSSAQTSPFRPPLPPHTFPHPYPYLVMQALGIILSHLERHFPAHHQGGAAVQAGRAVREGRAHMDCLKAQRKLLAQVGVFLLGGGGGVGRGVLSLVVSPL